MGIIDTYAKRIHEQLRCYVVWPPHDPVELGAYGELKGGVFTRTGTLKVRIEPLPSPASIPYVYSSEGVRRIEAKAALDSSGTVIPGKAGLEISFDTEYAMCIRLARYAIETIKNLEDVNQAVRRLVEADAWDSNLVVVTKRHVSEDGTILVSNASGASVKLEATGQGDLTELGNITLGLQHRSGEKMGVQVVGAPIAPFVGLMHWGGVLRPRLKPKNLVPGEPEPSSVPDDDACLVDVP